MKNKSVANIKILLILLLIFSIAGCSAKKINNIVHGYHIDSYEIDGYWRGVVGAALTEELIEYDSDIDVPMLVSALGLILGGKYIDKLPQEKTGLYTVKIITDSGSIDSFSKYDRLSSLKKIDEKIHVGDRLRIIHAPTRTLDGHKFIFTKICVY